MRVLIVASYNRNHYAPFIVEQVDALRNVGVECDFFGIIGKGALGYLKNLPALKRKIKEFSPDVVHAHYGLCGLLAGLQRRVPVVTTYHGSDINNKKVLSLSRLAMTLSAHNIFVSERNVKIAGARNHYSLVPCGVCLENFPLTSKSEARKILGWPLENKIVLFAGAFDNKVKNSSFAIESVARLKDVQLVEMKGFSRGEVAALMCAADAFLMTSFTEGSPQVIKEAMACGCPIVSVDVGDVAYVTDGVDGCYIADRTPESVAAQLQKALAFDGRTEGRKRIVELGLTNDKVAEKLIEIYQSVMKDKSNDN